MSTGQTWRYDTNITAAVRSINSYTPNPGPYPNSESTVGTAFGSYHPGGCNVAFGDGSIRFMPETIDLTTHRALGTRSKRDATPDIP